MDTERHEAKRNEFKKNNRNDQQIKDSILTSPQYWEHILVVALAVTNMIAAALTNAKGMKLQYMSPRTFQKLSWDYLGHPLGVFYSPKDFELKLP